MPRHYHNTGFAAAANFGTGGVGVYGVTQEDVPGQAIGGDRGGGFAANYQTITSETGGNQAHNNLQPYAVTRYIIKALPDDIQQFAATTGPGLSSRDINGVTNTIDLSTTEIGLNVTDDFQFDGSGKLDIVNVDFAKLTLPPNFPVQTVQAVKKDTQEISGPALGANNFVEITGMSKTITRHNTGSKVRIQVNLNTATNSGNHGVAVRLLRDGVVVDEATGNQAGSRLRVTSNGTNAGAYGNQIVSFDFIDTPPVSESGDVNYSIDAKVYSAITGYINRDWYNTNINDYSYRTISTLTLTELTPDV